MSLENEHVNNTEFYNFTTCWISPSNSKVGLGDTEKGYHDIS